MRRKIWLKPLVAVSVLTIIVVMLYGSAFAQEKTTAAAMKEYRQIIKIKDPAEKIAALKKLVKQYPDPEIKLRTYGAILRTYRTQLKDKQKAESFAKGIIKKETDAGIKRLAYINLLDIYRDTDATQFEKLARKIIKTETHQSLLGLAYSYLGEFYARNNNETKLEKLVDEVMNATLIDAMVFNNWAWSLIDDDLNPGIGLKLALHGEKLLTMDNFQKLYPNMAEKAAKKRLKRFKGYMKDTIGWGYFKIGQYEKAAKALEEALVLYGKPDPEVNLHLGAALAKQGKKERAIELLTSSLMEVNSEEGLKCLAQALGKTVPETETYLLEKRFAMAKMAEDFTLADINGKQHTLSKQRGKVVIVNFFSPT